MCGIAGLAGPDAQWHQTTVKAMGTAQHYRGPDGTTHAASSDGRAVLAMNTLLIVDPLAHPGPYLDRTTGVLLAFNGEIYNYQQQAAAWGIELGEKETDAHLVLKAWTKLGPSCLDGLDGMFALAAYDPRGGKLFLTRDRLGEKPLYWRLDGGRLTFASEVTTLTGYGQAPLIVRPEMLAIETPVGVDTPFQGIQLLAPATLLTFDVVTGSLDQHTWWQLENRLPFAGEVLGHDPRIGRRGMRPGLGFGGGCLPKDIRGFIAQAVALGAEAATGILREADAVNTRRREAMIDLAREQLGGDLMGKRITVWGAAFKPNTDDIRDSPALAVAQKLHELGATVTVTDPKALDNARKLHPELDYVEDPIAAVQDADLLLHLTEWAEFGHIDPHRLAHRPTQPLVIDGRGALNPDTWRQAGWTYRALGRP